MKAEQGFLKIPVTVITHEQGVTVSSNNQLFSIVASGKTREEAESRAFKAFVQYLSALNYWTAQGWARSIWRHAFSKRGGTSFWFTIVGYGLSMHYNSKEGLKYLKKMKLYKFFEIKNRAVRIGRLRIGYLNEWRSLKKRREIVRQATETLLKQR